MEISEDEEAIWERECVMAQHNLDIIMSHMKLSYILIF